MTGKRVYRKLTQKQLGKVRSLTKKGKTQAQIAKTLGIAKQSIATAQRKVKIGVRRPSPFWQQVKRLKAESGLSHKEAREQVFNYPKWGKKRHKNYQTTEERIEHMKELRLSLGGEELGDKIREYEAEDVGLGETPK